MANQITYSANIAPANASIEVSYNGGTSWQPLAFATVGSLQQGTLTNVPAATYAAGQLMMRAVGFPASSVSSTATVTVLAAAAAAGVPSITSFSPASGLASSTITITGSGFTGATVVSINSGAVASFTVSSDTQITAVLTSSQASGTVRVTTPSGTGASATAFTVTAAAAATALAVNVTSARLASFPIASGETSASYLQQFVATGGSVGTYAALPGSTITGSTLSYIVPGTTSGTVYVQRVADSATAQATVTTVTAAAGRDQLLFEGDSITFGISNGTVASPNYPTAVSTILGYTGFGEYLNMGQPGKKILEIQAINSVDGDLRADFGNYRFVVAPCLIGTNNMDNTFASITADLTTFHQSMHARGIATIAVTPPPRTGSNYPAVVTQIGNWIRANYETVLQASACVSLDLDSRLVPTDTTVYATDGTHLTATGYGYVAQLVAAGIQTAVARLAAGVLVPTMKSATVPANFTGMKPGTRARYTSSQLTYSVPGPGGFDFTGFWHEANANSAQGTTNLPATQSISANFWGTKIAPVFMLGQGGFVEIRVDTVLIGTIDLLNTINRTTNTSYPTLFTGLTDGAHTLEMRIIPATPTHANGNYGYFDCLVNPL